MIKRMCLKLGFAIAMVLPPVLSHAADLFGVPPMCTFDYDVSQSHIGFPESVLDIGDGEKQWTYRDGKVLIFKNRKLIRATDAAGKAQEVDLCPEEANPVEEAVPTDSSEEKHKEAMGATIKRVPPEVVKRRAAMAIAKVKHDILERLKDPDSAKFRRIKVSEDGTLVCGEVNAKNSYGGYTGFTRFTNTGESGVEFDDGNTPWFGSTCPK
jgi:hypothetical protein